MDALAVNGGKPVKTTPFGTGQRFDQRELDYLREALEQNTLFYYHGQMTRRMTERFAEYVGSKYAVACSSGTAAVHVALLAAGVGVGDEVITAANTDLGSICGVLYQNAVPIFADVQPYSYLLDPAEVEKKITPRTKAIIAIHLAGNPCDMDIFCALADKHDLVLIEDCAQAYGCRYKERMVGSFGRMGCFSLNEYKHINCGDGGVVVTDDKRLYELAHNFTDKCYDRLSGMNRRMWTLAPNYRITELQSAVALAQLEKVEQVTSRRHELGDRFNDGIADLPGLHRHKITPGGYCSYWFTGIRIDPAAAGVGTEQFVKALQAEGIKAAWLGYSNLLATDLLLNRNAYQGSHFPFEGGPHGISYHYSPQDCPTVAAIEQTMIHLPINEFFSDQDIDEMIAAVRKVSTWYAAHRVPAESR